MYSKGAPFIHELIQNADDNKYSVTQEEPYISFTIEPDRIIVDSNEDGFTSNNVRAICSLGKSNRTNVQSYNGEKGIGFKSVFTIAKKVHIQSGPFSFAFEYTFRPDNDDTQRSDHESTGDLSDQHAEANNEFSEDVLSIDSDGEHSEDSEDDALGMITPIAEAYEDLPAGVRTRITLVLNEPPMTEAWCNELFDTCISDTLLLFLTRLKMIRINRYLSEETKECTTYQLRSDRKPEITAITTTTLRIGSAAISTESWFRVVRKVITGLPPNEARPGKSSGRSAVVLAFPIDFNEQPVIASQNVFAYLPVRKSCFTVSILPETTLHT